MDCVYIGFVLFKTLSSSEYLHITLEVSLNTGDPIECHQYFRVLFIAHTKEWCSTVTTL